LDLPGGNTQNGQLLQLWDCNGLDNQKWIFASGAWKIQYAADPSKCIDNIGSGGAGNKLGLWDCIDGQPSQKWGYDSNMMTIYLADSMTNANLCMDLTGCDMTSGNQIQVWDCNGHRNQKWDIATGPSSCPSPAPTPGALSMNQGIVKVDGNDVVVMATDRCDYQTYVVLLTKKNAWVKKLQVSGGLTFGVDIACGDKAGGPAQMDPSIANWQDLKCANSGIGALSDSDYLRITFLKPKTFGVLTNEGTLTLPGCAARGKDIFLFWPEDAPGDAWNNFVKDLDAIAGVAEKIKDVEGKLLDVVKNGEAIAKAVGLM